MGVNMQNNLFSETKLLLGQIVGRCPNAVANIKGNGGVCGVVEFYDFDGDTIVVTVIHNLPITDKGFYGFHIHEVGECEDDFSSAGGHYSGDTHPMHRGDMPVLLSSGGDSFMVFLTDRFVMNDIVGRSVIIHYDPDDYASQPAGNSGKRIACGVIRKL